MYGWERPTSWERPVFKEHWIVCFCVRAQSCPTLCDPVDWSPPGSSVYGFSRQEYWSRLPFSPPGDLPNPGIKPTSHISCIGRRVLYNWSCQYIPTQKSGTVASWLAELPTGEVTGKETGAGRGGWGCAKGAFTFAVFSEFVTWKLMYFLCTF